MKPTVERINVMLKQGSGRWAKCPTCQKEAYLYEFEGKEPHPVACRQCWQGVMKNWKTDEAYAGLGDKCGCGCDYSKHPGGYHCGQCGSARCPSFYPVDHTLVNPGLELRAKVRKLPLFKQLGGYDPSKGKWEAKWFPSFSFDDPNTRDDRFSVREPLMFDIDLAACPSWGAKDCTGRATHSVTRQDGIHHSPFQTCGPCADHIKQHIYRDVKVQKIVEMMIPANQRWVRRRTAGVTHHLYWTPQDGPGLGLTTHTGAVHIWPKVWATHSEYAEQHGLDLDHCRTFSFNNAEELQHHKVESFVNGLTELFDKPAPLRTRPPFIKDFEVGGSKYALNVETYGNPKYWSVSFAQTHDKTGVPHYTHTATGSGHAPQVFATVLSGLHKMIQTHQPDKIDFSAGGHSRISLYRRMVNRFADKVGYNWKEHQHQDTGDPESSLFLFTRKGYEDKPRIANCPDCAARMIRCCADGQICSRCNFRDHTNENT